MSLQEFEQLLKILPDLSPEQLNLLRQRVDATTAGVADEKASYSEEDQALQRRLLQLGILSEIKPSRRAPAGSFRPITVSGEPISETIIRERR